MDGEVVALGIGRDALGHGPGDEHAVALEAEVPVQAAGVVLLHDEAGEVLALGSGVPSVPATPGSGVAPGSRFAR